VNIPFLDLKSINASFHGALLEAAAHMVRSGQYIQGEEGQLCLLVCGLLRHLSRCGDVHWFGLCTHDLARTGD
jgi:hypothetical protein